MDCYGDSGGARRPAVDDAGTVACESPAPGRAVGEADARTGWSTTERADNAWKQQRPASAPAKRGAPRFAAGYALPAMRLTASSVVHTALAM